MQIKSKLTLVQLVKLNLIFHIYHLHISCKNSLFSSVFAVKKWKLSDDKRNKTGVTDNIQNSSPKVQVEAFS